MNEVNEASPASVTSDVERVVMCDWHCVYDKTPKSEQVVLIHVKALGDHGIVSAWWCNDEAGSCWVALDDLVQYEFEDVDYWRELVALPDYT